MAKKKDRRKKIMMVSTGTDAKGRPTHTTYYTIKGDATQEKLSLNKYDPYAVNKETGRRGLHVKFNEKKLPK